MGSELTLFKKLKFSTNIFGTFLTNALTIQNASFNGEDSIIYEGPTVR